MIITLYAESKNGRLRYYTIHDRQPALDSRYTLTTAWRTENARGRERHHSFATARERDEKLQRIFHRTASRGYRLLYSFDRRGFGRFGGEGPFRPDAEGMRDGRESRA